MELFGSRFESLFLKSAGQTERCLMLLCLSFSYYNYEYFAVLWRVPFVTCPRSAPLWLDQIYKLFPCITPLEVPETKETLLANCHYCLLNLALSISKLIFELKSVVNPWHSSQPAIKEHLYFAIVGKRLLGREGRGDAEERGRNAVFAGRVLCTWRNQVRE